MAEAGPVTDYGQDHKIVDQMWRALETPLKAPKGDPVNHPDHYTQYPVEVIEITELLNFNVGNAVKYLLRHDYKGNPIQDLEKAAWYVQREIQRRKKQK